MLEPTSRRRHRFHVLRVMLPRMALYDAATLSRRQSATTASTSMGTSLLSAMTAVSDCTPFVAFPFAGFESSPNAAVSWSESVTDAGRICS